MQSITNANFSFGEFLIASYVNNSSDSDNGHILGSPSGDAKDNGLSYRQQLLELFTSLGTSPITGTIKGSQLVEWAARSGIMVDKRGLKKCTTRSMKWEKLSLEECSALLESYERSKAELVAAENGSGAKHGDPSEARGGDGDAGAGGGTIEASSNSARSDPNTTFISLADFIQLKMGWLQPVDLARKYRPRDYDRFVRMQAANSSSGTSPGVANRTGSGGLGGSGTAAAVSSSHLRTYASFAAATAAAASMGPALGGEDDEAEDEDLSAMMERFGRVNFRLQPNTFRLGHRMRLFVSTAVVFVLIAITVQLFMSLLWMSQTTAREELLVREFSHSFELLTNEFAVQNQQDITAELIDAVTTENNWITKSWSDALHDTLQQLKLDHAQQALMLDNLAATHISNELQGRFDVIDSVRAITTAAASSDDMSLSTAMHILAGFECASNAAGRCSTVNTDDTTGPPIHFGDGVVFRMAVKVLSTNDTLISAGPATIDAATRGVHTYVAFDGLRYCATAPPHAWPLRRGSSGVATVLVSQVIASNGTASGLSTAPLPEAPFTSMAARSLMREVARSRNLKRNETRQHRASVVMAFQIDRHDLAVCFEFPLATLLETTERELSATVAEVADAQAQYTATLAEKFNSGYAATHSATRGTINESVGVDVAFFQVAHREVLLMVPTDSQRIGRFSSSHRFHGSRDTAAYFHPAAHPPGTWSLSPEEELFIGAVPDGRSHTLVDGMYPISGTAAAPGPCHRSQRALSPPSECTAFESAALQVYLRESVRANAIDVEHVLKLTDFVASTTASADDFGYDGSQSFVARTYLPSCDCVVASVVNRQDVADLFITKVVLSSNAENALSEKESVVAVAQDDLHRLQKRFPTVYRHISTPDRDSEHIGARLFQLTAYANGDRCYGPCARPREAITAIQRGFTEKTQGAAITVNYQPVPVLSAFVHMHENFNAVLLHELSVEVMFRRGLRTLVKMLDGLNAAFVSRGMDIEVRLARRIGTPVSRTFDPQARCAERALCLSDRGALNASAIVWRSDCPTCLPLGGFHARQVPTTREIVEYLTALRRPVLPRFRPTPEEVLLLDINERTVSRNVNALSVDDLGLRAVAQLGTSVTSSRDVADHQGELVLSAFGTIKELNTALIIVIPNGEAATKVLDGIFQAIGLAFIPMVLAFAFLVFLTLFVYQRIEKSSQAAVSELEQNKQQFYAQVENIVPSFIKNKILSGHRLVSQYHKDVAIGSIDIVNFNDLSRTWSTRLTVGYMNYIATVHAEVARRYNITLLHVFGDTVVSVSGLEIAYGGSSAIAAAARGTAAINMARYAELMIQLMHPDYQHNPHRFPQLVTAFPSEEVAFINPQLRVGLHFGPVFSGSLSIAGVPRFDCFGTSMALANRMQVTSLPNRIHITVLFKDVLHSVDYNDEFDYEPPRKTVVKGQSTITSFLLYSAYNPMPQEVLASLHISLAHKKLQFDAVSETGTSKSDTGTGSSRQSSHKGQQRNTVLSDTSSNAVQSEKSSHSAGAKTRDS